MKYFVFNIGRPFECWAFESQFEEPADSSLCRREGKGARFCLDSISKAVLIENPRLNLLGGIILKIICYHQ